MEVAVGGEGGQAKRNWLTHSAVHKIFKCKAHALLIETVLLNDVMASPSFQEHRAMIYTALSLKTPKYLLEDILGRNG